jgi:AcrR family transcriptional regulator
MAKPTPRGPGKAVGADRIVDAALALAAAEGWERVRLRKVADALGIPLAEVNRHFRDLNGVADAWFARAWTAMLAPPPPGFFELPAGERLSVLMLRWFDALSAHRRVTVQMLATKMWPFHPHHWVPMLFDLSRTILWLRDAAALDAESPCREVEEVALTWLFLATLAVWATDGSAGQQRTRRFLRRCLSATDRFAASLAEKPQAEPAEPESEFR